MFDKPMISSMLNLSTEVIKGNIYLMVSVKTATLHAASKVKHCSHSHLVYRKNSKYWDIYFCTNSVDSDQTALKEQSDQDLYCLPFLSTSFGGITAL